MKNILFQHMNPRTKLILVGSFLLLGIALGAVLAAVVAIYGFHIPLNDVANITIDPDRELARAILWMNNATQVGAFLFPVLLAYLLFGQKDLSPLRFKIPLWFYVIAPIWILSANGIIDLLAQLNKAIIPAGSALEKLLLPAEQKGEQLVQLFLQSETGIPMSLLLFSMAILPGLCEEFLFRGLIQPLLIKTTNRIHLSVWVAAALFSFIHFQFYGFIPRLILGAMLGYLVLWTGSIWPAIIAHITNNAIALAAYYVNNESMEAPISTTNYIVSFIFFTAITYFIYRHRQNKIIA